MLRPQALWSVLSRRRQWRPTLATLLGPLSLLRVSSVSSLNATLSFYSLSFIHKICSSTPGDKTLALPLHFLLSWWSKHISTQMGTCLPSSAKLLTVLVMKPPSIIHSLNSFWTYYLTQFNIQILITEFPKLYKFSPNTTF